MIINVVVDNLNLVRCEGDSGKKNRAQINKMAGAVHVLVIISIRMMIY